MILCGDFSGEMLLKAGNAINQALKRIVSQPGTTPVCARALRFQLKVAQTFLGDGDAIHQRVGPRGLRPAHLRRRPVVCRGWNEAACAAALWQNGLALESSAEASPGGQPASAKSKKKKKKKAKKKVDLDLDMDEDDPT